MVVTVTVLFVVSDGVHVSAGTVSVGVSGGVLVTDCDGVRRMVDEGDERSVLDHDGDVEQVGGGENVAVFDE